MSPRALFSAALRLIGIWKLLDAADYFLGGYNISAGVSKTDLLSASSYYNHAMLCAVLGLLLVFGAPFVATLLVPPMSPGEKPG
jgi:hypothetical protein